MLFTGQETFEQFREKLARQFEKELTGVKIGRQRSESVMTFDGQTLKEYLTKNQLYNCKHNMYVVFDDTRDTNQDDQNDSGDDVQEVLELQPDPPALEQFPNEDDDYWIPQNEIQVLERIGQGGEASVYRALWNGTPVALKECATDIRDDPIMNEAVQKEARMLKSFTHPNVLRFCGITKRANGVGLVVELMDMSLMNRVFLSPDSPLTDLVTSDKKRIAIGILSGITWLHSKRVVHGDMKLENVLLSSDLAQVKICDFGLARLKRNDAATVLPHAAPGTLMYKSPEMFLGRNVTNANFHSDIWATAGVICELFVEKLLWYDNSKTAKKPKTTEGIMKAAMKVRRPPSAFEALSVDFPEVQAVLAPCFKYDPAERPTPFEVLEKFQKLSLE